MPSEKERQRALDELLVLELPVADPGQTKRESVQTPEEPMGRQPAQGPNARVKRADPGAEDFDTEDDEAPPPGPEG